MPFKFFFYNLRGKLPQLHGKILVDKSPIFLLISNLINKLCLHHFLENKITETNQSLKTDATIAY